VEKTNIGQKEFAEFVETRKTARSGLYDQSIAMASSLQQKLISKLYKST